MAFSLRDQENDKRTSKPIKLRLSDKAKDRIIASASILAAMGTLGACLMDTNRDNNIQIPPVVRPYEPIPTVQTPEISLPQSTLPVFNEIPQELPVTGLTRYFELGEFQAQGIIFKLCTDTQNLQNIVSCPDSSVQTTIPLPVSNSGINCDIKPDQRFTYDNSGNAFFDLNCDGSSGMFQGQAVLTDRLFINRINR